MTKIDERMLGEHWGSILDWLLPVLQLGELIKKQEVSTNKNAITENTKGYVLVTAIISTLSQMA